MIQQEIHIPWPFCSSLNAYVFRQQCKVIAQVICQYCYVDGSSPDINTLLQKLFEVSLNKRHQLQVNTKGAKSLIHWQMLFRPFLSAWPALCSSLTVLPWLQICSMCPKLTHTRCEWRWLVLPSSTHIPEGLQGQGQGSCRARSCSLKSL